MTAALEKIGTQEWTFHFEAVHLLGMGMLELVSALWMELAMFGMAAVFYFAFTGGLTRIRVPLKRTEGAHQAYGTNKKQARDKHNGAGTRLRDNSRLQTDQRHAQSIQHKRPSEKPSAQLEQRVSQAVRQGQVSQALQLASGLTEIPTHIASRLLLAVGMSQCMDDEQSLIAKLAGKIAAGALEAALCEASTQGNAEACRRLHRVAGWLCMPLGQRALDALVKGVASDAQVSRALVEEASSATQLLPPKLTCALLSVCALCKDTDLAAMVFEKAQRQMLEGMPLEAGACAGLVKVYIACEMFDRACAVYEDIMQAANVQPDPELEDLLIQAATKAGRHELAQAILENPSGDMSKYARQISRLGKDGDLRKAVELFQKLKDGGQDLPTFLYNCLLDACVQCGDVRLALQHFADMKALGLADIVSYNTIMKGQLAIGNLAAAECLLPEIAENGRTANRITYHGLLNARVQKGDSEGAWALVSEMRSANVTPNAVTCSILLKGLTRNSSCYDVARVVEVIDGSEKTIDEVLFASLAEACIRTNRLDLLSERTKFYAEQGNFPRLSSPTYGSMIKAYGHAGDVERVLGLWQDMVGRDVRPTAITLGCMVEALVSNRRSDDAWKLVQQIQNDNHQKEFVNTVIYSTLLKGFSLARQPTKVMELYDEMRAREIPCNTIVYNTILNAFARSGAMHRVSKLLEDMKSASPCAEPDIVTYSTIVKGYCASGELDKGFQIVQEMKEQGKYVLDEVMYNTLLDGCAKQHRLDDALRLLEEMRTSGVTPSNYTLSILVKILGRSRRLGQAFATVEQMSRQHGLRPNVHVYTCLIQACFHNRQVDKAVGVHNELIADGICEPDEKLYTCLVKGCLYAGAIHKAVELVRCSHHLRGHSLPQCLGPPPGVEPQCVKEVIAKLGADSKVSQELLTELRQHQRGSDARQAPHVRGPRGGRGYAPTSQGRNQRQ